MDFIVGISILVLAILIVAAVVATGFGFGALVFNAGRRTAGNPVDVSGESLRVGSSAFKASFLTCGTMVLGVLVGCLIVSLALALGL